MQVNIGEKIKELRKRDGRKQEELATALGITAQAVSRWEAGTCYPDVSLIPAIANYFHVSIDFLFGYQNDRDNRIREYLQESFRRSFEGEDDASIIEFLRQGLEEFPGEPTLQKCLAGRLSIKGCSETVKPNPYLEEAAALYESLSKTENDIVSTLINVYAQMGKYEKAENRAKEQPLITECKEILLASLYEDKKGTRYRGEAILSLLHSLEFITMGAIGRNENLRNSQKGLDILETLITFYVKIFDDTNYGIFNSDLCMLYLSCAKITLAMKDYDQSLEFWEKAYVRYAEYHGLMEISMHGIPQKPQYASPLLAEVEGGIFSVVDVKSSYLKDIVDGYPAKLKQRVKKDPRYAKLFSA